MTWWSWILIWVGLVIALLVMLGLFAWSYVRKGLGILRQIDELSAHLAVETPESDAPPVRRSSLFTDRDELLERRRELAGRRAERVRDRRTARIRRGRLLVLRNPLTE